MSGNPKGRPTGVKNLATDLEEELSQKILVTEGGKPQQTTKQRAMVKSMMAKALKGDTRAASVLISLILGLEQSRAATQSQERLDADDLDILAAYRDRILAEQKGAAAGAQRRPTHGFDDRCNG
jgi:hypothetical protein